MSENTLKLAGMRGMGEVVEESFIRIVFQSGLPSEVGINGCRVEDVIDVAIERLNEYQEGPLACLENEQALRHLHAAGNCLHERVRRRQAQGVLNTMIQHAVIRTEDEDDDFSATSS